MYTNKNIVPLVPTLDSIPVVDNPYQYAPEGVPLILDTNTGYYVQNPNPTAQQLQSINPNYLPTASVPTPAQVGTTTATIVEPKPNFFSNISTQLGTFLSDTVNSVGVNFLNNLGANVLGDLNNNEVMNQAISDVATTQIENTAVSMFKKYWFYILVLPIGIYFLWKAIKNNKKTIYRKPYTRRY